ncbi:unnamed protein product [Zymoseptoria tritici ST99CH_1E4]|uniref:Peptidase S54 rhomboid domain-containing protein n=1 Tax=Zymoseptoria tritici ST99CH_1E4 TaxID=1276532 RepID=A0A2H1H424_ZYMTR|nr:unnamed protein product [Zymoseptoria tritici ST99CH_1E4]
MADGAFFSQTATWLGKPDTYGTARRLFSSVPEVQTYANHQSAKRAMWAVIGVNAAVWGTWVYSISSKDKKLRRTMDENFLLSGTNLKEGRYHTMVTSAFSHIDPFHFIFNMVSLNAFGSVMSFVPGIRGAHILAVVFGSAVAGSAAMYYQKSQQTPQRISRGGWLNTGSARWTPEWSGLGASGAVMGMAAAATCLRPFTPMGFMFIPIPIPLWAMMIGYVGMDTFFLHSKSSKVGHAAHLGGFAFGAVYYLSLLRNRGGLWKFVQFAMRKSMKLPLVLLYVATALAKGRNQLLCSNVTPPTSFAKWISPFSNIASAFVHDIPISHCNNIFGKHSAEAAECRQHQCPTKYDRAQFSRIEIASWPQYANISDDGMSITTLLQGYAFAAPECGSLPIKRRAALGRLLRMTGFNISWTPDAMMPREYVSWAVNGAPPVVTIDNTSTALDVSTGTYGHFETFHTNHLASSYPNTTDILSTPVTLNLAGCHEANISLPTTVETLIVPPTGLTIISDIDDILRVSEIWDPKQAFLDLFTRPYQPWLDLPSVFASWHAAVPDAHFHYTSDVPELSSAFYANSTLAHYPFGSFDFRPTVFTSYSQVSTPRYHNILRQLETFPSRNFVLLGDTSTSSTLSAYVRLANEFPEQIQCIIIRDVSATEPGNWIVPTLAPLRRLKGKFLIYAVPAELRNVTGLLERLAGRNGRGVGCGGLETDTGLKGYGALEAWVRTGWGVVSAYTRCWLLGSVRPHVGCRFDRRVELGRG